MTSKELESLEKQASLSNLLLRLQLRRPLNLWTFRLVVAQSTDTNIVKILGEMKGWAYEKSNGLQLDTMQVSPQANKGIGHLIWAATMAWALESTPCKRARLLAIHDDLNQHNRLKKYFQKRGFQTVKEVGSAPMDLPLRIVWGGAGSLMTAECQEVFEYSRRLWELSESFKLND